LLLGQTLGNFLEMDTILGELRGNLREQDYLLVEVDTKKDMAIYENHDFQKSFLSLIGINDAKPQTVKGVYYEDGKRVKFVRSDSVNVYFTLTKDFELSEGLVLPAGIMLHTGHSEQFYPEDLNRKMREFGFDLKSSQKHGKSYCALYRLKSSTPQAPQQ
ncbi:L-histidine N(alpha)-methyltransferase, partial [Candidatus Woesearchaeota archaeon]|nr:L-histidine N(alpha)-methyltransferase [Candidatus Woesearchaeota archaeon]